MLITNNHVIGSQSAAHGLLAEFDFERDPDGMPLPVTRFALAPERLFITDDRDDLDFSLVAIGTRVAGSKGIESFGFLALSGANNKHALLDVDADEAERISFDKVQKYQVSVLELARRTGLDFGEEVVAADSFVGSRGQAGSRRVERLDQVSLEPRVGHARSSRKRAGDDRSARRRAAKAR